MRRILIREVIPKDVPEILDIYSPFIENTHTSFEWAIPDIDSFSKRIEKVSLKYPWLIASDSDKVIAYAYGGAHRSRKAYQWTVETSVYIAEGYRKRGIAAALYQTLFQLLRLQGYFNALAIISLPNPASIQFHQKHGFEEIGTFREAGFKRGQWHNTYWMQKRLLSSDSLPAKVISPAILRSTEPWQQALAHGTSLIKA